MTQTLWGADRLRIPVNDWMNILEREYLNDYIRSGGSAVKFVSGSECALSAVVESLRNAALRDEYFFVRLDPASTRSDSKKPDLHRIDRFFLEVTRDVDWKAWASAEARAYLEKSGVRIAEHRQLNNLDGIAADNGRQPADLLNQFQREFATRLITDHSLAIEFRTALTALSRAQLVDSLTPTTEEVLLEWFAGRTMPGASAALKRIQIYGRIDGTNARYMLASFCRWLPRIHKSGLVVVLDFRPYEARRKPETQRRMEMQNRLAEARDRGASQEEYEAILAEYEKEPPITYSQLAYNRMLEMLRRFIDEIDWFERFCLIVLTSPQYCQTDVPAGKDRHYSDYHALETRIGLEVRDEKRVDPAAALVHLEVTE